MIEERRGFPSLYRVAARAIRTNLAAVLILMATGAFAGKSEVSSIEVFDQYASSGRAGNEISLVAVRARDTGMLPCECEAGLAVVQGLAAGLPMNKLKIDAVVIRMAAGTIFAGPIRIYPNCVHAAPLRHAFAYLRMTLKTFQLRRAAAQVVALCTVRGS